MSIFTSLQNQISSIFSRSSSVSNSPANYDLQVTRYGESETIQQFGINQANGDHNNNYEDLLKAFTNIAEVYAPLKFWADNSAKVGYKVFEINADGKETEIVSNNDRLFELLEEVNDFMGFSELKANELICSKLLGNSYINFFEANTTDGKIPRELWLMPPQSTEIRLENPKVVDFRSLKIKDYAIKFNNDFFYIEPEYMMHRKNTNPLFTGGIGLYGLSDISPAEKSINSISKAYSAKGKLYSEGAKGIFTLAQVKSANDYGKMMMVDQKELDTEQERLAQYGKTEGKNPYMMSRLPMNFQNTSFDVKQLQLSENLIQDADIIASCINMPIMLFRNIVSGTFNNKEQASKDFYLGAFKAYEDEFYKDLTKKLQSYPIWENRVIRPDFSGVPEFTAYMAELQTMFSDDVKNGLITRNEYLKNTNRATSEIKEFSEYMTLVNGTWLPLNYKPNEQGQTN